MSDISKCPGEGCPLKASCKRYTAQASPVQSWMLEAWDGERCGFYYRQQIQDHIGDVNKMV